MTGADKILVLETGRVVEFDSPSKLLRTLGGSFKAMVDKSANRDELYRLAAVDAS